MNDSMKTKRDIFLECNWSYDIERFENYNYRSLWLSLSQAAYDMHTAGKEEHFKVLTILANVASLYLVPERINDPFKKGYVLGQDENTQLIADELTSEDLDFFDSILDDVEHHLLRARLADMLWVYRTRKNHLHARKAIDAYTEKLIDKSWYEDIEAGWVRAIRLGYQVGDIERLEKIKTEMFEAIQREISNPDYKFLSLAIGRVFGIQGLDKEYLKSLALLFFKQAEHFKNEQSFEAARQYFDLAAIKFNQMKDYDSWANTLLEIAKCYEMDAEKQAIPFATNSLYYKALEAYRAIPRRYRNIFDLEDKYAEIQSKISESGKDSVESLQKGFNPIHSKLSEIALEAQEYVRNKKDPFTALYYFINIYSGPDYKILEKEVNDFHDHSLMAGLFTHTELATDGRTVAKIPPIDRGEPEENFQNQDAKNGRMLSFYKMRVTHIVNGYIWPALDQISSEFRFSKDLLRMICMEAPIVPRDRINLITDALWYGFEYEFAAAIHLICPQLEHMVRMLLKAQGVNTINYDDGIANEVGLSNLLGPDRPQAKEILGKNLFFEMECIFTKPLGFNLRNNIAHGLLNDVEVTHLPGCTYAWWMVLRMIVLSAKYKKVNFEND